MRIEKEVRNGGVTESGLTLFDREGESYQWFTRHYYHALFTALEGEWFRVRMTLSVGDWGQNVVKNVRLIK